MIMFDPIYLLIALPSWLVSLYFLRQFKRIRESMRERAPALVLVTSSKG